MEFVKLFRKIHLWEVCSFVDGIEWFRVRYCHGKLRDIEIRGMELVKAIFKGIVLAGSEKCVQVEGNYYFSPNSLAQEYFQDSVTSTMCGWKGLASCYHVVVNGELFKDVAWYYDTSKEATSHIAGYVAFGQSIQILV